ncbi:MAG: hypothetical protein COB85_03945 [Bacteroidetes bacterium]|nr:MAG: hypothetical protein COB85_03945 [Bacteroidota bacterium]
MSIDNFRLILLAVSFSLLIPPGAQGQNGVNSPYSRFGLGDMESTGFAQSHAMGGFGIGLINPKAINLSNPASFGYIRKQSFLFEIGLQTSRNKLILTDTSQTTFGTSISYFALAFPITKWWGSSFGIKPFSKINYRVIDQDNIPGIGKVNYTFIGNGGLNQVYWGNAFRYKNLSMGINASYIFGPTETSRRAIFENANTFHYYTIETQKLGALHFNYGLLYRHTLDSLSGKALKNKLTFSGGLTFDLSTKMSTKRTKIGVSFIEYADDPFLLLPLDTTINIDEEGETILPGSFGIGISTKIGERWLFGVDYSTRFWSNFSSFGVKDSLANSSRFSIGMQFNPDFRSNKYFNTIYYRLGAYYENTHLQVKGTRLSKYGTSFGIGLPLRKLGSVISISYETGKRGTIENNLIQENYWNVLFGLTINDIWFLKRKYD